MVVVVEIEVVKIESLSFVLKQHDLRDEFVKITGMNVLLTVFLQQKRRTTKQNLTNNILFRTIIK